MKSGPHRTVYRVALPSGTVYVKHCRINGPRAWAREVMRPAEGATGVRERVAPARARHRRGGPAGVGHRGLALAGRELPRHPRPRSGGPVHRLHGARFPAFAPDDQGRVRRQLARGLGRFLALLHENGVTHPDPHPGNLLVELPRLADAALQPARCSRGPLRPAAVAGRRAAKTSSSTTAGSSSARAGADRARFWHEYRLCAADAPGRGRRGRDRTGARTHASNRRFWAARTARYKGTHRTIRKVRAGGVRGLAVRDLPDGLPPRAARRPGRGVHPARYEVAEAVREFDRRGTGDADARPGREAVILKRVNVRSVLDPLKNLFRSLGRAAVVAARPRAVRAVAADAAPAGDVPPPPRRISTRGRVFAYGEGARRRRAVRSGQGVSRRDRLRAWAERLARRGAGDARPRRVAPRPEGAERDAPRRGR